jgi:hypothetical protein
LFFLLKPNKEIIKDDEIVSANSDVSRKNKKTGAIDAVPVNIRTVKTFSSALDHHNKAKSND